jgi:hypothetical protein
MGEAEQSREMELHRRRLVHYHYVENTKKYNGLHYAALTDDTGVLRSRLFTHASDPWEGETLALKVARIQATEDWERLMGGGTPCPLAFDSEDISETMKLGEGQRRVDDML